MAEYIFISYSRTDNVFCEKLARSLEKAGIPVWVDQLDLLPGTPNFDHAIRRAIAGSAAVVYIGTPNASRSTTVQGEIQWASDCQRPIIPLWVGREAWSACAPLSLITRQNINFLDVRFEVALTVLINSLTNIMRADPTRENLSPNTAAILPHRPAAATRRLRRRYVVVATVVLIAIVGVATLQLVGMLNGPLSSNDLASLVCTAYKSQNYDTLIARVDPNYRGQVGPSGPFDATAKSQLKSQLASDDSTYGKVETCSYTETLDTVTQASHVKTYNVLIKRVAVSEPVTLIVYIVNGTDHNWYVSRTSDFGMPRAGV